MDVLTDPPSNWILRGTGVFVVESCLADGEGKGEPLIGRHDFATAGSEKRKMTA